MNVYDFDGTIYDGDSSVDFFRFCFKHYKILRCIPGIAWNGLLYFLKLKEKTPFKQSVYHYFRYIPDMDTALEEFWAGHEHKLKGWYLNEKMRSDDVIISASPEFQLRPVCDKLGVKLLASRVDRHTGAYTGLNCDGKEKVRRFYEAFPGGSIDCFYSDSDKDIPLAKLAAAAYKVSGDEVSPWKL